MILIKVGACKEKSSGFLHGLLFLVLQAPFKMHNKEENRAALPTLVVDRTCKVPTAPTTPASRYFCPCRYKVNDWYGQLE